ncbi:MAG TPA: ROK family protein [Candidatus Limnocylindrales bacterium]|nr:ROK family protein [Candidatus Limnocylindrales bacterium]
MTVRRVPIGQRSETVRRANLSAIVGELHSRGPQSRSELVARTGLTRSAIRGLIGELTKAGLVGEERAVPLGNPGRPSPLVRPEPEGVVVLALEIAVDSLAVALVGLGGNVLASIRVDRPRDHVSVDAIVADLVGLADQVLVPSRRRSAVIGVGVAVAGVVRRTDGFVSMAPNLGWRDVALGERLTAGLGLAVPLEVANEADLGALAEVRRGAARGADHVIYLSGEVGVGGGIIVDGRPLLGVAGYGGEIGHLPINPAGLRCACGSIGCWETEVGASALLRRAGRATDGGRSEVTALLAAAAAGDPVALAALEETGDWLGLGLAGLVNILNPGLVVFGGLFEHLYPFIERRVRATLDDRALRAPRELVGLAPSALGDDAPLLGAAELAFEPFLADPARWLQPRDSLLERASA